VRVTGGTLASAERGDWVGRKDLGLVWLLGLTLAILIALAAVIGTARLVSDVRDPTGACQRELPIAEGLAVDEVARGWPPPLIRCEVVDRDLGQESFRASVTAVTSTHLAVVAALDAIALALVVAGVVLWRSRHLLIAGVRSSE
jgi:hypothetical protein